MPTLNWIGKKAVINHDRDVPFHLLQEVPELSFGDKDSGNLLIQGDNLIALKSLLPYYAGRVKCIYIDPPYNTGKEGWVYNDNVNDPVIRAWINQVVGKEAEDLSRHDKWLCMMYPRLKLLREFLKPDGVIFVSIDDNEQASLRLLMDELFGIKNMVAQFTWRTDGNFDNQAKVKICHEYVLMFAKDINKLAMPKGIDPSIEKSSKLFKAHIRNTIVKNGPKNPISGILLPIGFPAVPGDYEIKSRHNAYPWYEDNVIVKNGKLLKEVTATTGWSSKDLLLQFIDNGCKPIIDSKGQETWFELTKTGAIEIVKKRQNTSHIVSVLTGFGSTQNQSNELKKINIDFSYPKPVSLIRFLISLYSENSSIVLDSFAGSATTGEAVYQLNKTDKGNRNFILIEMLDYAQTVTAKRLRSKIDPSNSGFRYYRLGIPLFDEYGNVFGKVSFSDLAKHVFFSETGSPLPDGTDLSTPFIGAYEGRAIYLLYNGILKDRNPRNGNVLTREVLSYLPEFDGPKVVYGTGCRLSAMTLRAAQIEFKQIPYELKR